jgi:uroporphyrinogen-III decarboxylase
MGMMARMMEQMGEGKAPPDKIVDDWGVTHVGNKEAMGGMLPEPGNFILKDILDWKKVIKAPPPLETSDSWWADKAKKDIERAKVDRSQSLASVGSLYAPFSSLIAFMGFTEGLCALFEEPEAVKELLNWQCDYYMPVVDKIIKYYEPEVLNMGDDTATRSNPFFSVEMYQDIFKPIYLRLAKPYVDRGLPVIFHNCGRCEDFVPDMCDFGVKAWEPAQTTNDLPGVKKNNDVSIMGGYDWTPPSAEGEVTEEYIRQSARDTINRNAPGGHYAWIGMIMTETGDPNGPIWNGWLMDEVNKLTDCYYDK